MKENYEAETSVRCSETSTMAIKLEKHEHTLPQTDECKRTVNSHSI